MIHSYVKFPIRVTRIGEPLILESPCLTDVAHPSCFGRWVYLKTVCTPKLRPFDRDDDDQLQLWPFTCYYYLKPHL